MRSFSSIPYSFINSDTARWLNELTKSKYAFIFGTGNVKFNRIIIEDFDVKVSDRENTFELELTYKDGDNNISI